MLAPDDVPVIVRRRDANESVPHLGTPELFLGRLARDLTLEHDVAVIRRPDDAPAVLRQKIDQAGDLGQSLGLFGDVLTEPRRVRALTTVLAIQLVADGPEDVNEDVGRTGHG